VSGKPAKCEKGGEQNRIGENPLEDHFWNSIKEVFKDQIEWRLVFDDEIHLLEKENDHINEDQAAQT
jgi:hypothetical protein